MDRRFDNVHMGLAKAIADSAAEHDWERRTDEEYNLKKSREERKKFDEAYQFIIQRPYLIYTSQIKGLMKLIELMDPQKQKRELCENS